MPLVLLGSTDVAVELESIEGLSVPDVAAEETVGEAVPVEDAVSDEVAVADGDATELVGETTVEGRPPVEPKPIEMPTGLAAWDEVVAGSATESVDVGSVDGGTTTVLWITMVVTPESDVDDVEPVGSGELGLSEVVLSVKVGISVDGPLLKLANRSLNESLLVLSEVVSDGVACEEGESLVMVKLLYCRFKWRGK